MEFDAMFTKDSIKWILKFTGFILPPFILVSYVAYTYLDLWLTRIAIMLGH